MLFNEILKVLAVEKLKLFHISKLSKQFCYENEDFLTSSIENMVMDVIQVEKLIIEKHRRLRIPSNINSTAILAVITKENFFDASECLMVSTQRTIEETYIRMMNFFNLVERLRKSLRNLIKKIQFRISLLKKS